VSIGRAKTKKKKKNKDKKQPQQTTDTSTTTTTTIKGYPREHDALALTDPQEAKQGGEEGGQGEHAPFDSAPVSGLNVGGKILGEAKAVRQAEEEPEVLVSVLHSDDDEWSLLGDGDLGFEDFEEEQNADASVPIQGPGPGGPGSGPGQGPAS
jgi:hypothetical protein